MGRAYTSRIRISLAGSANGNAHTSRTSWIPSAGVVLEVPVPQPPMPKQAPTLQELLNFWPTLCLSPAPNSMLLHDDLTRDCDQGLRALYQAKLDQGGYPECQGKDVQFTCAPGRYSAPGLVILEGCTKLPSV